MSGPRPPPEAGIAGANEGGRAEARRVGAPEAPRGPLRGARGPADRTAEPPGHRFAMILGEEA